MAKSKLDKGATWHGPEGALYLGRGDYFVGIPARDLTAGEWMEIPAATRARLLELGLYAEVGGALPTNEVTNAN